MKIEARSPEEYLSLVAGEHREAVALLRDTINNHLPDGFAETISYGMIAWVVPHSLYPAGYHCNPKEPLPFMSLAAQKNHVAFYHMGLYMMPALSAWFAHEYQNSVQKKPDMSKSCVRFKKAPQIPLQLMGQLVQKVSVHEWVGLYETALKR